MAFELTWQSMVPLAGHTNWKMRISEFRTLVNAPMSSWRGRGASEFGKELERFALGRYATGGHTWVYAGPWSSAQWLSIKHVNGGFEVWPIIRKLEDAILT